MSHRRKHMYIHFPIIPNKKKCLFIFKYFDYSLISVPETFSIFVNIEKKNVHVYYHFLRMKATCLPVSGVNLHHVRKKEWAGVPGMCDETEFGLGAAVPQV